MYVACAACAALVYGGVWCCVVVYSNNSAAAAASLEEVCSICNGSGVEVWCIERHPYCGSCFNHTVSCQVYGEGRKEFVANGCRICCPVCPMSQSPPMFVMHKCANSLTEKTFTHFQECLSEKAVIAAQKAAETQFESKLQAFHQQHGNDDTEVARFVQHIDEWLVRPRCPNQECKTVIVDFEACAALKCPCSAYICAWCVNLQPAGEGNTARVQCHAHVRQCLFNPTPNLFPPQPHPKIWEGVMQELGRKRVKDYIQSSGGVWWLAVYDGV